MHIDEAREMATHMVTLDRWQEIYSRHNIYSLDPTSVWIDRRTKIGREVFFAPNVQIRGACVINSNVTIDSYTVIDGDSIIDNAVEIGVRNTIRRAVIGYGTRIPYDAKLIDFECGVDNNIAHGVTVSNFGGLRKRKVVMGNGCFVGTDVNLVAPLTIGNEVRIFHRTRVITSHPIPDHTWIREEVSGEHVVSAEKMNRSFKIPGHFRWIVIARYISEGDLRYIRERLFHICPSCKNEDELEAALTKEFPSTNGRPFFKLY